VQPCARPTNLATLNRKRLAVDASIWIYQFLKAVRDKEGNALRNSHVVGFFRRICKLLWYGIQPVFVFDGGAPELKRATLNGRRQRREGRREDAARTAGKLLAVQMHRIAEEEEEKRKRRDEAVRNGVVEEEVQEKLPSMDKIVYADELGMSNQERLRNRRFHRQDAYHLPDLHTNIENMGKPNDPRIMSVEELEEYARQFHNGEDIDLYDFSKIDFDGEFFQSLPPADRYNILNAARIRSRLRMGLSKEQLDDMFPDRMAFSRFQIERVKERNNLTQRLMYELGMSGTDLTLAVNGARVAGEKNREYILVKNEGVEGGWALGVVSREKDLGNIHKPIDVDALEFQYQAVDEEEEFEDEEFEDVPIEGLNRLPKLPPPQQQAADLQEEEENEESLFVDNDNVDDLFESDEMTLDEQEDIRRAIVLSLETQKTKEGGGESADEFEDVPAPTWLQRAVEAPKPIVSTSGRMVAHIVNNRSNAAVAKRRESSSSSDSDMDLQAALAAARRKKQPATQRPVAKAPAHAPVKPNRKYSLDGPLPFEKLNWRSMFAPSVNMKETEKTFGTENDDRDAESQGEAGGFLRESSRAEDEDATKQRDEAPRLLPPWLQDTTDIRESLRMQQQLDREIGAQDEELAREEEDQFRRLKQCQIVEIDSSSNGDDSDIEILDAPPPPNAANRLTEEKAVLVATASPTPLLSDISPRRSPSPEEDLEFEDVPPLVQPRPVAAPVMTQEAEAAQIEMELFGDITTPPAQQRRTKGLVLADDDGIIDPDAPAPEEFDGFSDPEEEELLAQLAQEAEEHARFASQLNNRPQRENQEAYEQELRALRNQQKKDRRDADEVTQIMVTECQALLRLFGIPYITAPMEAEAQCAELVRLSLVDGIVTDDSDTFLFGGTRVYKNMFNSNKFVECYLAKDLETELSLSREQLIALAQLLGSDYTEGLPGVGPVTALEILSEFPGKQGLETFKEWWEDVQKRGRPKDADAGSVFRRKFRKSHATKLFLPLGFPSPAVFDAYHKPEVDNNTEKFQWGVPDLEGLRQFLMATIGWSQERTDEVLVPVIRDMNKRAVEGTQSNITRYFEGSVGTGAKEAFAPRLRVKGSKRMREAVNKLRARSGSSGSGLSTALPVMAYDSAPKTRRKRKARDTVVVEDNDEEREASGDNATGNEGESTSQGKARGKGKRIRATPT